MRFYFTNVNTLLDPFNRVRIPHCIGYLIRESNKNGKPDDVVYHANCGVTLYKNKISIEFPTHKTDVEFNDDFNVEVKSVKLTSLHINPFSHYNENSFKECLKKYILIQRREVPIGKFRVHSFKGMKYPHYYSFEL